MSKTVFSKEESISEIIRIATREILMRRPSKRILFLDLRKLVGEVVKENRIDFSSRMENPKKLRPDYFIRALLTANSNLAIFSNGAEVWVTYASNIVLLQNYQEFKVVSLNHSKAEFMRKVARKELEQEKRVAISKIKEAITIENIQFRIQALLIRNSAFIISSEKEGVFVTKFERITFR